MAPRVACPPRTGAALRVGDARTGSLRSGGRRPPGRRGHLRGTSRPRQSVVAPAPVRALAGAMAVSTRRLVRRLALAAGTLVVLLVGLTGAEGRRRDRPLPAGAERSRPARVRLRPQSLYRGFPQRPPPGAGALATVWTPAGRCRTRTTSLARCGGRQDPALHGSGHRRRRLEVPFASSGTLLRPRDAGDGRRCRRCRSRPITPAS